MKDLDYKELAKELLDNLYYDGMVFVIYSDGETEITTQNAGYFPNSDEIVSKIPLDSWYWESGVLGDYDLDNLSETDKEYLIDYLAEDIAV
ncbi:MAG: hypothetical protein D8H99_02470 [Streptococcus sp.]|nr:MAG: hypothetical protein D8H99_02470 [Streptococcus sp.]